MYRDLAEDTSAGKEEEEEVEGEKVEEEEKEEEAEEDEEEEDEDEEEEEDAFLLRFGRSVCGVACSAVLPMKSVSSLA